jgi:hypothetical protein
VIEITDLKVRSWSIRWLDISWTVEENLEDAQDYRLRVERSESEFSDFIPVSSEFQASLTTFRDGSVHLTDKWLKYYYRLRLRDIRDDSTSYSEVASLGPRPPLYALEIIRRHYMILREKSGRKVLVFPRKTSGQRCPTCWDAIQHRSMKSNCPTCHGTTYSQAYLSPVVGRVQIDPSPRANQYSTTPGMTQNVITTGRCIPYPDIKPNDLLVEAENIRWSVVSIKTYRVLQYPVKLELVLARVDPTDAEMNVEVDWDIEEPSPAREFTNPHNIEAPNGP